MLRSIKNVKSPDFEAAAAAQHKSIPFPAAGDEVSLWDGQRAAVSENLVQQVKIANLDPILCKHVAAASFWLNVGFNKNADVFLEMIETAKLSVGDSQGLLAELDVAQRVVDFTVSLLTTERDASVFTAWLFGLIPDGEVSKIYRPWNSAGVQDFTFTNADFTPSEFVAFGFRHVGADLVGVLALAGSLLRRSFWTLYSFVTGESSLCFVCLRLCTRWMMNALFAFKWQLSSCFEISN